MILMPLGAIMDYFVYPEQVEFYFKLRLLSSLLVGLAWVAFVVTGKRYDRCFGVMWYLIPTLFISWMIYNANDPASPYYAGLNIVLLALGLLSPWTYRQNILSSLLVVGMYLAASFLMEKPQFPGSIYNNLYFLVLTAIIVGAGSYAHYRQRYRESELKWELNKNRRIVEESNRKLKELDQAKSRFFANISHELRTPLTLLLAPLETLIHRLGSEFDQGTRNLLGTMHANGMRLLKLINDLLDLVRLESGSTEVEREPVQVAEFMLGLASALRQVAEDKKIQLVPFADPALGLVQADRDKLEKIVLNLTFNALKFTPAGGRVDMRAERQGESLVLIVKDTGMGISEKNMGHVFSRFWQADDSSRRKFQGAGIGLALVKELAEIQGGTVAVESHEGKGTTFTVRIPYLAASKVPPAAPLAETPAREATAKSPAGMPDSEEWLASLYRRAELFPAMTLVQDAVKTVEFRGKGPQPVVLIADDEPDMLRFLKSQLQSHYQVFEAVDGQQAIEKAAQFLPDVILLDVMMPEKDGLQACRELRENTSTQSIPIILLTARADEETKLAALSAGASDFLPKPFSTTELHVRIKNLVESYHNQRKLSKQNQLLESTIEQLKETESLLVQTEKLASLGRMSAGIIHEINNPLNFATTGLFTLRNKGKFLVEEERAEYAEILEDVEEGIKRVQNIVSDLRAFTHPDMVQLDHVEVDQIIASALRFLSNEWKDQVEIVQDLPANQTIWANQSKLTQVVVNLLQNSLDALKTKAFAEGKPTIWIEGREDAAQSSLIIRDNGEGIDPLVMDKIFDPFFTTKDVGRGMGLGLSICYRIVQDFEGRISVRSEPGKFSEFKLEFPSRQKT